MDVSGARMVVAALACLSATSGSALCVAAASNMAGGFSALVATSVTTGTEPVNGRTLRYLDNGILRASFAENGCVVSLRYLKPGMSGTPKDNGVETVSQRGSHKAIYYYMYPDNLGDSVYSGAKSSGTHIDLAYVRSYQPGKHKVAADAELHYVLGKGNSGLYCYIVMKHPGNFSGYKKDLECNFIQCIWPIAHDNTDFLCENLYLDDFTKTGLFINGVQQRRNGLQPTKFDHAHAAAVPGMPKEIVRYTTGVFAGCLDGKYSYNIEYARLGTFGLASDKNKIGLWIVAGGNEYIDNGPTAREYAGCSYGLILYSPHLSQHYGSTVLNVKSDADWKKIYGPWMFYINSEADGAAAWADARKQAGAEKAVWPYAWVDNPAYEPGNQRATVRGKLVISDPLRPQANAAGAWVGLAAPDDGKENSRNNWQFQSDG